MNSKFHSRRLPRSFYLRPSTEVAPGLLGCFLHRELHGVHLVGKIVETEAYTEDDPASHSYRGETDRTRAMFGEAGHSYVYFTYGMHYCFNVTCQPAGRAEAVLIRAIEPIEGLEVMRQNRGLAISDQNLTNGPAKLCRALGIGRAEYGLDLVTSDELYLTAANSADPVDIVASGRIGIRVAQERPWRFLLKDNRFVSHARRGKREALNGPASHSSLGRGADKLRQ